MKIECKNPQAVVKRAFYLAWQACGRPFGMGVLQDYPGASEDDVWNNVTTRGDYPGSQGIKFLGEGTGPGESYGDYVFGRMMKLMLKWDDTGVSFRDDTPMRDYQSWCRVYPTYEALVRAAVESVGKNS